MRRATHSDYTVTNFEPLREMQTAILRQLRVGGDVLNWAERIPAEQALRLKTVDAAWQVHADDEGMIKVGGLADLTVLASDLSAADPHKIADIQVVRTIVGGKTVYEA